MGYLVRGQDQGQARARHAARRGGLPPPSLATPPALPAVGAVLHGDRVAGPARVASAAAQPGAVVTSQPAAVLAVNMRAQPALLTRGPDPPARDHSLLAES
jgi:hypothetical protein